MFGDRRAVAAADRLLAARHDGDEQRRHDRTTERSCAAAWTPATHTPAAMRHAALPQRQPTSTAPPLSAGRTPEVTRDALPSADPRPPPAISARSGVAGVRAGDRSYRDAAARAVLPPRQPDHVTPTTRASAARRQTGTSCHDAHGADAHRVVPATRAQHTTTPSRLSTTGPVAGAAAASAASGDDDSSEDDSSDRSTDSASSAFSTVCVSCHARIARADPGACCDVRGCRVTRCHSCVTPSKREDAYRCRQHAHASAEHPAAPPRATAPPTPCTVARLPRDLARAAVLGVEHSMRSLGDWRSDRDLCDIAHDLAETVGHMAASTKAKGATALRRLRELIRTLPSRLSNSIVNHDLLDIILADFVARRTRRARRAPIPEEWQPPAVQPQPQSVRNEVCSIIGLARVAGLLPSDPKGTIPHTRRTMRACGCMKRGGASPRHYTFLWELITAYRHGHATTDVSRFSVWCFAVTCIHFLLRPRYGRLVNDVELTHAQGDCYCLEFGRGDKTNQPALPPTATAATAAAGAAAGQVPVVSHDPALAFSSSSSSDDDGVAETRALLPPRGLPSAHPRVTGSAGPWLHAAQRQWREVRGGCGVNEPLFCRAEPARQTTRVPVGARRARFRGNDCYIWPATTLTPARIKKELVAMLAPVIGLPRAKLRTAAGLRGGGEMELAERGKAVAVRATIGWWVAKRIAREGQMVVYEGCSMESMHNATRDLGTTYIRVLAPGVYSTTPHGRAARSILQRAASRRTAAARPVPSATAGSTASAAGAAGATSASATRAPRSAPAVPRAVPRGGSRTHSADR